MLLESFRNPAFDFDYWEIDFLMSNNLHFLPTVGILALEFPNYVLKLQVSLKFKDCWFVYFYVGC